MTILERNLNLSQRMVEELGRTIICGETVDDSLPTEAELCEKFGVSRSAVREAVKMLSAKGLVTSKPRQGIRVQREDQWNIFDPDLLRWMLESKPSLHVLKEFLQVRIAIEPEAAVLAACYSDPTKLEPIEHALNAMRDAQGTAEKSLDQARLEADIAFHVSILYASNNRFYIRLRDFISTALRVSIRYTNPIKGNHDEVVRDHLKVLTAIKNREPQQARQAMFALIDEAVHFIDGVIAETATSKR